MKYFLKLSGEHPRLPAAEVECVLEGEQVGYETLSVKDNVLFIEVECVDSSFLSRLAYTRRVSEWLGENESLDELSGVVYDQLCDVETFRVTSKPDIQVRVGKLISEMGLEVNLTDPDAEVVVLEDDGMYVAGVDVTPPQDFEERKAQHRPYFHPTSLHPKLARAAVNLAKTGRKDTVLDPFSGTGGILIEAGLMGMNPVGWDIDEKMIEGAGENLREYGLDAELECKDATEGSFKADALVADLPYGRASYACKDVDRLYREFGKNAQNLVADGANMCLIHPAEQKLAPEGFKAVESFDVRIHKSLTRRVSLFSNV